MTRLAASVAAASSPCSTYAQRRAISLHMAETLAVIALFGCCWLSASVAKCRASEARIVWGHVLSVVRGSGQPLDSCPKPSVRQPGAAEKARAVEFTDQVACLGVGLAVPGLTAQKVFLTVVA